MRRDGREALPARRQRGVLAGELPETVHDAVAQRRFESDEDKASALKHAIDGREVVGVGAQEPMTIDEPQVRAPGRCGGLAIFSAACGGAIAFRTMVTSPWRGRSARASGPGEGVTAFQPHPGLPPPSGSPTLPFRGLQGRVAMWPVLFLPEKPSTF